MSFNPIIIGFEEDQFSMFLELWLKKVNPAGVILFKRNIKSQKQTKTLIANIKSTLDNPFVGIDAEGGVVKRLPNDLFDLPSAKALHYLKDEELVVEAIELQSDILNYLGFNLNFAPVLDLFRKKNDVISVRAFSENYEEISKYGKLFISTLKKKGIVSVSKHFPGHGSTEKDTHLGEVVCQKSRKDLLSQDIFPFLDNISDIPSIMPSHVIYEKLDPTFPATFSKHILQDILRDKLDFKGGVFSDCIEMKSISSKYTEKEIVKMSFDTGINCLLTSYSILKSKDFISNISRQFENQTEQVEKSKEILLELKKTFSQNKTKDFENSYSYDSEQSLNIHKRSIEVVSNKAFTLKNKIVLIQINTNPTFLINDQIDKSSFLGKLSSELKVSVKEVLYLSDVNKIRDKINTVARDTSIILITNEYMDYSLSQKKDILVFLTKEPNLSEKFAGMNIFCRGVNHITPKAIAKIINDQT